MVLEIVTPEAVLYKGKVSVVTLPGAKGSFQILENHAPIVSLLEKGTLSVRETLCSRKRRIHPTYRRRGSRTTRKQNNSTCSIVYKV